tara:strand:+ start:2348 stop:2509 length:162 start_codon:yes stop_codon:yes gene_type:complete
VRKKVKKYYLVQTEDGKKYYGAFPLGEQGKLAAEAYARMLKRKHKESFYVVEA